MRFLLVTCLVAVSLCSLRGFAQEKASFPEGIEPKTPLKNRFGGDMFVMVVVPGTALRAEPRESANPIALQTTFREVFLAYREDVGKQFLLVRTKAEPFVWGWIRESALLMEIQCKRSEEKDNPTFIKAALKNDLRTSVSETISLYGGPGPQYGVVEQHSLAQIMYVYGQMKGSDQNDYLLLGWDAEWNPDRPTESIRGWVKKSQCTIWDHRIAVYYNRKNIKARQPVYIFRSLDDLRQFQNTGKTVSAIAMETAKSDSSLTYDRSRFPILQKGPIMKIAFIGDLTQNLKISIDRVNQAVDTARNMQVLFLIDGTTSMGKYFQQVQLAVRDYISSIPNDQERARYHFAVAVYRDYEDGKDGEMELVADFDDPGAMARLGSLKERSSPLDKTLEEAVFNGIVRSVASENAVAWKSGTLKAVIIIGDHSNHPVDPRGFTVDSVVRSLSGPLISGFRFHAINVNGNIKNQRLNEKFLDQMQQIGKHFPPMGLFSKIAENSDVNEFRSAVIKSLRDIVNMSGSIAPIINAIRTGESAPYGTELTDLAIKLLQELGIKLEDLKQSGIHQVSREGWVAMNANGQQQMEPWVYIERTEMDEFRGFLASLMRSSEQRQQASQIVKDAVMRVTGDPLKKSETIADYVKRAFALPFREDSMILSRTPEQLQQALGEQNFWKDFRKRIGYSYETLGLVSEERDPSALRWDDTQNKWIRTTNQPADMKSWVTSPGGQKFCWIPLEFLP
jgi:hypothetical protein